MVVHADGEGQGNGAASRFIRLGGIVAFVVAWSLLAGLPSAQGYDLDPGFGSHGGVVFRGDEAPRREYNFGAEMFGQLLLFRHPLDALIAWRRERRNARWEPFAAGYRVSVGSLTNEDFYLEQEAYVGISAFDDHLRLRYRLVMDEDYDARYIRNIVEGEVVFWEGLFAGVSAELDADKEFIDVGLALGWDTRFLSVRLDALFPDLTWNDKAKEDARYRHYSRGLIARVEWSPTEEWLIGAYAEMSNRVRFASFERGFEFSMSKQRFGGYAFWESEEGLLLGLEVAYERADKRFREAPESTVDETSTTHRNALLADVRARIPLDDDRRLALDLGAHLIFLDDRVRTEDPANRRFDDRLEGFGSVGFTWRPDWFAEPYDRKWAISPTLFVGYTRAVTERRGHHQLMVNLAPRVEIFPLDRLRIVLNPAMHFHDGPKFAGGNVQVLFTF